MAALTAVLLNYIILRYLNESEFKHTAFMFECEASANKIPFDGNSIPPGLLVKLVQKGIQYMEMEENLKEGEDNVDKEFRLVEAIDLIKKVGYKEQQIEADKEKKRAEKLSRKGKLRKARERGEADRKALEKEEADRDARDKEETDRKAREKEAARKARKKEGVDIVESGGRRIRTKRTKVETSA